jgi:hypothetical protein
MPDQLDRYQNQAQGALSNLNQLTSGYSGISNLSDIKNRFGISSDVSGQFNPLFKNLAANRSRRLRGAGLRAGRSANPELGFSDIEQGSEESLQGLLGNQAQAGLNQGNFAAQMLSNVIGSQDQFGFNKAQAGLQGANQLFGNQLNAEQFRYNTREPSFLDTVGTVLGGVAGPLSNLLAPGAGAMFQQPKPQPKYYSQSQPWYGTRP